MKKLLLASIIGVFIYFPGFARDFLYEYEGQTLAYTVIDEDARTCQTKAGLLHSYRPGNSVTGRLIIPSIAKEGDTEYTVIGIGDYAFRNCNRITSVIIPNSITFIGKAAFTKCQDMTSVNLPNSITYIGSNAFSECKNLTFVEIPNSVTVINDSTFLYCNKLATVTIPNSVEHIGNKSFQSCPKLNSVIIPNSVITIGNEAFRECKSLTSVTIIGNSLKSIGNWAFYDCSNLYSITLPNSIETIGEKTFCSCHRLTSIAIPNSLTAIREGTFSNCVSLTTVIIPNSVISIGYSAFSYDSKLSTIIIGHRLKIIAEDAFENCPASDVYITAQTPPATFDNSFSDHSGKLHVPGEAAAEAYHNAECWKNFGTPELMSVPADMEINMTTISGNSGDNIQLTAKLIPEDVSLPYIFWTSTDTNVATVDSNGLVTLRDGIASASCKIIAESLYADEPIAEITVTNGSGIDNIFNESAESNEIDFSAPVQIFNLQGVMVGDNLQQLTTGIYIVRQGKNVKKFAVK